MKAFLSRHFNMRSDTEESRRLFCHCHDPATTMPVSVAASTPSPPAHQRTAKPKIINNSNSLSTLNPTHQKVMMMMMMMDTAATKAAVQPGMPGGNPLTMRDVIVWHQEQAQREGELGFTMNFSEPGEIFKSFRIIDPSSEDEISIEDENENGLVATMRESHKAIVRLQQRKIIMDGAGALLAKTERYVDQKLRDAGVAEQELHKDKTLRQKIVQLAELGTPPPRRNFVAVIVDIASTIRGRRQMFEVNLPLKASMVEVYALLGQVVKALLSEKGLSYIAGGGTWRYQLIDQRSRPRLLLDKSLALETDLDYKTMLRHVIRVREGKVPLPVLTQVCFFFSTDT